MVHIEIVDQMASVGTTQGDHKGIERVKASCFKLLRECWLLKFLHIVCIPAAHVVRFDQT